MDIRSAIRLSGLVLVLGAFGCVDNKYGTAVATNVFEITPPFIGVDEGTPQTFAATVDGAPVAVTWESSAPTLATVSATGVVTTLLPGFAAITATQTANATMKKSASLTIFALLGTSLANGVARTGLASAGARGTSVLYRLYVPPGRTNLTVTLASPAANGDADIYVQRGSPPTTSTFTCASENGGNNESCSITNPATGTWYILLALWDPYANVTLRATYTPG